MTATDTQSTLMANAIESYNRYAEGLDSKNWPLVRSCFADEVFIDYGSISDPTGSPDVARQADEWLNVLQGVINGFDFTRHTITNHRFDFNGDEVSCTAYLTADHVIFPDPAMPVAGDQDVVTVIGEYTNWYVPGPEGLQICRSKLVVNCNRGNLALLGEAMTRAAALGN
jgi:hypothetical protein